MPRIAYIERNFRKTRTNMADPEASPDFRTYWEAWREAFAETFACEAGSPMAPTTRSRRPVSAT